MSWSIGVAGDGALGAFGALSARSSESVGVGRGGSEPVAQCRPVSPDPVAQDFSAWCRSNVRRPCAVNRSPSIEVGPPSEGRSPRDVAVYLEDWSGPLGRYFALDDAPVRRYGRPGSDGQSLPISTPMLNTFVGEWCASTFGDRGHPVRQCNIKIGKPVIANRLRFGEVARCRGGIYIHNLECCKNKHLFLSSTYFRCSSCRWELSCAWLHESTSITRPRAHRVH